MADQSRRAAARQLGEKMDGRGLEARDPTPQELAGMRPTGQQMFDAMTPAQQDEAYGPAMAQALREGRVKLADLTKRQKMDSAAPDTIRTASLEELDAGP